MRIVCLLAVFVLLLSSAPLRADERPRPPMVDPAIDLDGEPFGYFSRPTDHLGVMDGEHGFQVTAEGWLYTRRAEVVFMAGPDLDPSWQRIRTLAAGRIPVLQYELERGGITYTWMMFAATLDGDPLSPLYAFVRIGALNGGAAPADATLAAAVRHRNPPRSTARVRADPDYPFRYRSRYAVEDGVVSRDGRALVYLPAEPAPILRATLEAPYEGAFRGSDLEVIETTPVCPAIWRFALEPGEARYADLVVPLVPEPEDRVEGVRKRVAMGFDRYLASTVERWKRLHASATTLELPEAKAHDTLWTSLSNVAIARDLVEPGVWIQRVNELQYHTGFWPRDASYFCMAWWYMGLPEEGRRVVDHYFRIQDPDGSFEHDPENISPFAIARWYQLTGDREYAEKAFPFLWLNHLWLKRQREADPLRLMPRRGRYDNEGIDGHYTGHNFYNLCALREAALMARDLGKLEEAEALEAEHLDYRRTFLERLAPLVDQYGQIPPGLDTADEGANWGNLTGSYPTEVLRPDHPWIAKTSDKLRKEKYEEGLLVFDAFGWWSLHHYSTIKNTYADLLRGRDDLVVQDLYALLAHTSASNAGFEFCLVGWSNRDFGGNFSPHGWFAAKLIGLVRLMLAREEGADLHLLSALPPAWVRPGLHVKAHGLLTRFGRMDLDVEGTEKGLRIRLKAPTGGAAGAPKRVLVHVPWYADLQAVRVDGTPQECVGRVLGVSPDATEIELDFTRDPSVTLDYESAVEALKQEYRTRFDAWRKAHPDVPAFEPFPERRFPTREEGRARAAFLASQEGLAVRQPVRASSEAEGRTADHANDGVEGANTPWWSPAPTDEDPWWEVLLRETRRIGRVVVQTAEGTPPLCFRVEATVPGEARPRLLAYAQENELPGRKGVYTLFFPAVEMSRIRVYVLPGSDARLTEVQVFDAEPPWQDVRGIGRAVEGNLAHGARTWSSEWEGENGPWKAVDGKRSWGDGFWAGAVGHPQWWVVDLAQVRQVDRARLYFYAGGTRSYAWVLQTSRDGVRWRTCHATEGVLPATNEGTEIRFPKHGARYVKVTVLENTSNPAAHIAEVEVYGP